MTTAGLLREFITLWVVIDPVGTVPVFLAVTAGAATSLRRSIALRAVAVAFGVLLAFMFLGQYVLEALGLALPSFQIAGGIVLFLFAMTMVFGESKPESEMRQIDKARVSVFPLAIPSIASPGAMLAVVILTDNDRFSLASQATTALVMGVVLLLTLVLLLLAAPIHRIIGATGEMIISRVMGIILSAVAVDAVLRAFVSLKVLAPF